MHDGEEEGTPTPRIGGYSDVRPVGDIQKGVNPTTCPAWRARALRERPSVPLEMMPLPVTARPASPKRASRSSLAPWRRSLPSRRAWRIRTERYPAPPVLNEKEGTGNQDWPLSFSTRGGGGETAKQLTTSCGCPPPLRLDPMLLLPLQQVVVCEEDEAR